MDPEKLLSQKSIADILEKVPRWRKWKFTPEEQEDATQQLQIEVRKALPNFKGLSSPKSFIYRVAIRRCIDILRKKVRHTKVLLPILMIEQDGDFKELEFVDDTQDPVYDLIRSEKSGLVRDSLQDLSQICQETLDDFYTKELSYEEIALKRAIKVNTVGSRLSKCLKKLENNLKNLPAIREYFELPPDHTGEE